MTPYSSVREVFGKTVRKHLLDQLAAQRISTKQKQLQWLVTTWYEIPVPATRASAKENASDHKDSSEEARTDEDADTDIVSGEALEEESSWLNNTTTLIEHEREKDESKNDYDGGNSQEIGSVDEDEAEEQTDDDDDDELVPEREYWKQVKTDAQKTHTTRSGRLSKRAITQASSITASKKKKS